MDGRRDLEDLRGLVKAHVVHPVMGGRLRRDSRARLWKDEDVGTGSRVGEEARRMGGKR